MRSVEVPLGKRSYQITIAPGLLKNLGRSCVKLNLARRCAVISDSIVAPQFARAAQSSLKLAGFDPILISIPAGEKSKSVQKAEYCFEQLAAHRLERKSFIVALGGGVVGDLAGFAAAAYLRGIAFVQVPTTLLAQVDSSVGGKVGVNLKAGKNLVGAFHQPRAVLCDLDTLKTLPEREYGAGLAEVIKYGIIYDAKFFNRLERNIGQLLRRDVPALAEVIARSCEIKAEVVGKDETESGLRAILNFGHTLGHALEAISGYGKYLHGEAISIGQVFAAHLSARFLNLPTEHVERIAMLFEAAGLPTRVALSPKQQREALDAMMLDKKVSGGEVKFVLATKIGEVRFGQRIPMPLLKAALEEFAGPLARPVKRRK